MARHKISSLIVVNRNKFAIGIVTDRDLREKVVARGRSVDEPIKNIAHLLLDPGRWPTIPALRPCMKMIKYNIHHMPVIRGRGA